MYGLQTNWMMSVVCPFHVAVNSRADYSCDVNCLTAICFSMFQRTATALDTKEEARETSVELKKKRCGAKKHQYLAKQFKKKEKTRPDETRLLHSVACVFLTVRGSFWLHVFLFALSPVVLIYPSLVWVTEVVRWGLGHQEPSTKKQISLLLKSPKTLQRSHSNDIDQYFLKLWVSLCRYAEESQICLLKKMKLVNVKTQG